MNVGRETLRPLLVPGLVALVLVAAGIAVLMVTDGILKQANSELMRARGERIGVQSRLSQATDEERQIRERLADYQKLRQRGVLGEERRLDWIETIKEIHKDRGLYDIKYAIEPRRVAEHLGLRGNNDVDFMASPIRLEISMLHEGDLITLLGDMRARLAPHVYERSCRIDRVQSPTPGHGPQLRAECVLDLITIRDRTASNL